MRRPVRVIGLALVLLGAAGWGVSVVRRGARPAAAVAGWLFVTGALLVVLLGQVALVSEGALPRDDLAGRLPAGLRVAVHDELCGSGGCWREDTVVGERGTSGAAVAARLRGAGISGCRRSTWIPDLRVRCTDVAALGAAARVTSYLTRP